MKTKYHIKENKWGVQTADFLPKYDLVYGMPINDVAYSFPIGDGATGSLIWLEKDGVHIHINHVDLWQAGPIKDCFCGATNKTVSVLRHGAELVIKFDCPCFEYAYQEKFEGRLSLKDATVSIDSKTPFSNVSFQAFASAQKQCTVLNIQAENNFDFSPKINFKRWGSENFWRWYAIACNDCKEGLDGTDIFYEDGTAFIVQEFSNLRFCVGLKIICDKRIQFDKKNLHEGELCFDKEKSHAFSLVYNISIGASIEEAVQASKEKFDDFFRDGIEKVLEKHQAEWRDFWNQSYVDISEDYIENIFYLNEYYSNSQCKGKYPPHFTTGVWGFYHDYTPWMHYFHYNLQHQYHSLESAGHGELSKNYYDFRYNTLDKAREYAKFKFNKSGAFYHDVVDFMGNGFPTDFLNFAPGAQIAMMMYRRYLYSGDKDFLSNKALPVMRAVAEFYLNNLVKEEDGIYHIHGTTAYEGHEKTSDTLTDIVCMKALFGALIKHTDGEEQKKYQEVICRLPAYDFCEIQPCDAENGEYKVGIGKGRKIYSNEVVSCGIFENGQSLVGTYANENRVHYGFPDIDMSLLFPSGEIGLKDKGSRIFNAVANAVLLHASPQDGKCANWCMMPIYLARMGMSEDVIPFIKDTLSMWQAFPNGFAADGVQNLEDVFNTNKYYTVADEYSPKKALVPAHIFRHFDNETMPIVSTAVMEMLLQSYNGEIRIFPAVEKNRAVAFRLHAEGGFFVEAQKSQEGYLVTIRKTFQNNCIIIIPNDFAEIFVYDVIDGEYRQRDCVITQRNDDRILNIEFSTECIVLSSEPIACWLYDETVECKRNQDYKKCGKAILGSPNRNLR